MDEKELIRKSHEGDHQAFEQLIAPHRQHILMHCQAIVHDESIAEDLTQEAILKAFLKLNTFKEKAAFGTWLWRIAHNLCLNYLRKKKETYVSDIEIQSSENTPDDTLLEECLEKLSPKHKEIFELFYKGQLSQKEIALLLGIPHGTVRSRLHYARLHLRNFLS